MCRKIGSNLKTDFAKSFDLILKEAIDENGVITGENFMKI